MILKRCDKGHYYDGEIYRQCPECSGAVKNPAKWDMDYADEDTVTVALPRSHGRSSQAGAGMEDSYASEADDVTVALPKPGGRKSIPPQAAGNIPAKAAGSTSRKHSFKPVVGWLVCIQGKDFGGSFPLQLGKNYIGRSVHMDVMLHGDETIAMEKHAAVYYVPKYRRFAAEPGTAGKRFLVNKEEVLRPVWIKQHDILMLGTCSLMFFPCCGEHFSWEELLRRHRDSRGQ